jgi:hypothetical protein
MIEFDHAELVFSEQRPLALNCEVANSRCGRRVLGFTDNLHVRQVKIEDDDRRQGARKVD